MIAPILGLITWHPHLEALSYGLLVAALAGWVTLIHRNLLSRMSRRKALTLTVLRAAAAGLLMFVLLDPSWSTRVPVSGANKILALLDVSSSMDVRDRGDQPRVRRAREALKALEKGLPSDMAMKTLEFDTELRDAGTRRPAATPSEVRNTDIGGCLLALTKRTDLSSYAAIVLVTDGGDEPIEVAEPPPVPLYVMGVGASLSNAQDLSIAGMRCPASVEKQSSFELEVDIAALGAASFANQAISHLPLTLECEEQGTWRTLAEQSVDLSKGAASVSFKTAFETPGPRKMRVTLPVLTGELSPLNNSRVLNVDVRQKALHVLFFARELGQELKMLRGELVRDPGVTFTALFRTIGERFTVQGERFPADEALESGFPVSADALKPFDCVIIGAVPGKDWREPQMAALRTYVENGGAAIFLGDEGSFGPRGFAATPLAPLIPWEPLPAERDLLRGEFAVNIPAAVAGHPIVAGMSDLLSLSGGATIESVCQIGPLKAGAIGLMTVVVDQRAVPLIALQRFGKGTVLALASNTFWKWARKPNDLPKAYGLFWRQAVRNLALRSEGGQVLSVKWDRENYKPGERATAEIATAVAGEAGDLVLTASLTADGQVRQLPIEPLQGQVKAFKSTLLFEKRGTYLFSLTAHQGNTVLETYAKTLQVEPLLGEGARLELDARSLMKLAKLGGGLYVDEAHADDLLAEVRSRHVAATVTSEVSLVTGSPWFLLGFVGLLVCEWIIRRRMNLF